MIWLVGFRDAIWRRVFFRVCVRGPGVSFGGMGDFAHSQGVDSKELPGVDRIARGWRCQKGYHRDNWLVEKMTEMPSATGIDPQRTGTEP